LIKNLKESILSNNPEPYNNKGNLEIFNIFELILLLSKIVIQLKKFKLIYLLDL